LQLEASNLEAIVALGAALTELGQYDEAVEWLYAATEIDETHFLPKYYLGILYHRQQSYGEALEWFELALKNIQREEVLLAVTICHSSMG
jgi:tetratricopeptide (TPR) repeat protein